MNKQSYFFQQSEEEAAKTDELMHELQSKLEKVSKLPIGTKRKLINWLREKMGCNTKRTASYEARQKYEALSERVTKNMALQAMMNTVDLFISEF